MLAIITGVLAGSIFAALVMHIVENEYLNGEVIRLDSTFRMGPR